MGSLFITGSTGQVGRSLLPVIPRDRYPDVRLLVRPGTRPPAVPSEWTIVPGDLANVDPWARALEGVETVIHLAAATGKARPRALDAVNREATGRLVAAAEAHGVRRFVFVSSIAAAFDDRRYYPYAESKRAAEGLVRASRLDTLIVRPTTVFGPGSATLAALRRLAIGPVAICFGAGTTLVQPVHVSDLARLLVAAVGLPTLGGRTVEVGGPEAIAIAELIRRIRLGVRGSRGPLVRIPLVPLRPLLALVEPVLWPVLPFTAGQLASFVNDGRPRERLPPDLPAPTVGLDRMLGAEVATA
jgi:NADH dehydrogenase